MIHQAPLFGQRCTGRGVAVRRHALWRRFGQCWSGRRSFPAASGTLALCAPAMLWAAIVPGSMPGPAPHVPAGGTWGLSGKQARSSAIPGPPFGVRGAWIVDSAGRRLVLRGMDVSGDEYTPTNAPLPYDAQSFEAIRATGATVVRIPIAWANLEPSKGDYAAAAFARVEQIVGWAARAGLLVVLDMHQYDWSPCFGGNGVPAWAVPGCVDTNLGGAAVAAATGAETYFWAHLSLQRDLAAVWAKVVSDVGSVPSVLGYDLFNEPPAGLVPPEVFESTVLPRFYRILGRAIRKVQPRSLLFVEPAWLHSAATPASFFLGPVGLHRIVYAPHEYGSSLNDASGNVADAGGPGQFEPDLALSEEQAKLLHAPLWIGEWGDVDTSSPIGISARSYVPDMVTAQDRFMVGSAYWTWTSGSWPYTPGVQAALSRITPLAVAGMPRRFHTGERSLSLTWIASSGTTIVSLPSGIVPHVQVLVGNVHARLIGVGWLALSAKPGQLASVDITAPSRE